MVLLLAPLLAVVPGPARAAAPDAAGWWNTAHRAAVRVTPPPPPDVMAGDLLLQGGDPGRLVLDPGAAPMPSAYAALRFTTPEDATVGALTLALRPGAQAADVRAYATTTSWRPVENGAIDDAPPPDLSRYAVATLSADGSALTFPDIGKLVRDDGVLSVALLPGPADRIVVVRPTATALAVTAPASTAPAVAPPVVPVPPAVPATAPLPAALAPVAPLPAIGPSVSPTSPAPAPQVPAQPVQAAATSRRVVADDARTRVLVGLEALLVLAFFGLLGHGPLAALARLTGQPLTVAADRGVGRFRAARDGAVPRL